MLKEKIQSDLIEAQKAKDELRVSTLRLLLSAIKNFAIAKESTSYNPTDEEVAGIIQKEIKQRKESIEQFRAGSRDDLVEKETKELKILQNYLPEQLSEDEVRVIVNESIKEVGASSSADLGKVMSVVMPKVKGKADGSLVSHLVNQILKGKQSNDT